MAICYIVGAAPQCAPLFPRAEDLVIAADGGTRALAAMGITPHLVVGDFDSAPRPAGIPAVVHPPEKDDTDTALAIREGMARGFSTFALYGCTGGRLDHTLGAIQTALGATRAGARVFLVGEGTVGTVVLNSTLSFAPRGTVTVLSLSEHAYGVTLTGLKYLLKGATLTNDYPLGVSNEGDGSPATVSVKEGALYVLFEAEELPLTLCD